VATVPASGGAQLDFDGASRSELGGLIPCRICAKVKLAMRGIDLARWGRRGLNDDGARLEEAERRGGGYSGERVRAMRGTSSSTSGTMVLVTPQVFN
jgi:hypothetical protein